MARQGYDTNPAQKHVEVFYDFSGGMNTVTTNESMADKEAMKLINVNLVERGPVERRHGMVAPKEENNLVPAMWSDIGYKKWSEL